MKATVEIRKQQTMDVVSIPKPIMSELGLSTGDVVEIDIKRPKKNGGS